MEECKLRMVARLFYSKIKFMTKYLFNMIAILMVTIMSVSFSSCGDDGDDKNDGVVSIVGKWKYTFSTGYIIKQFNADNTGYSQEYDTQDGGWHKKHEFTYQYDEKQKRLYSIDSDGDSENYEVRELTNKTLVLVEFSSSGYDSEIETYVRQ